MNVTESTLGAAAHPEEGKKKTFDDHFAEANNLYKKCKPLVDSCAGVYYKRTPDDNLITEQDDEANIIRKMTSTLRLEKEFQEAMSICQAKDVIESALKLGNRNTARELKREIDALLTKATGREFQWLRIEMMGRKAALLGSLSRRYERVTHSAAHTSDKNTIELKNFLGKLVEKYPLEPEHFSSAIKEAINYEKRFSKDGLTAQQQNRIREFRIKMEGPAARRLLVRLQESVQALNENPRCRLLPRKVSREYLDGLSDEDIDSALELLGNAMQSALGVIEFTELLTDPQTPPVDSGPDTKAIAGEGYRVNLNYLTGFYAHLGFLEAAKLVKQLGASIVLDDIGKNILRIDKAVRELAARFFDSHPNTFIGVDDQIVDPPESERPEKLLLLAKGYEFIARECHLLAGDLSDSRSHALLRLGDRLNGIGECISKELEFMGMRPSLSKFESKQFIASLFDAGQEDEDVEEHARDGDISADAANETAPSAPEENVHGSEAASLDEKEHTTTARRVQERDSISVEKSRRVKAINKDKRELKKIEQKLAKKTGEMEQIKQALEKSSHSRYLTWDIEDAPKKAVKFAQLVQRKALNIAAGLESLEEYSPSKGAVLDEAQRNDIDEYKKKAADHAELEKRLGGDGRALQIAGIQASLAVEAIRKSNAAKRLLIELVDLEKDLAPLTVTACKILPHYPQAKNRFGILETKDGQLLYDHVVEFRVALKKAPEFLVHFHFRLPLEKGKSSDHYMEMEIHDWNVQAAQKQGTEEKLRARQLEGGKKVLTALAAAWKKTLEVEKSRKATAQAAASSKPRKSKGKSR
jgi:hypothetical protein